MIFIHFSVELVNPIVAREIFHFWSAHCASASRLCASSQMKNVLCALPARSLQWFQENVSMCAVSGQIVARWKLMEPGCT
jgi:hypothetical protein